MANIEIDQGSGFCFGVGERHPQGRGGTGQGRHALLPGRHRAQQPRGGALERMGLVTINHEEFGLLHDATGDAPRPRRTGPRPTRLPGATASKSSTPPAPWCSDSKNASSKSITARTTRTSKSSSTARADMPKCWAWWDRLPDGPSSSRTWRRPSNWISTAAIRLYSQTTKSLSGFREVVDYIQAHIEPGVSFQYYDTICRQVANRIPNIREFAAAHDLVFFVSGKKRLQRQDAHSANA